MHRVQGDLVLRPDLRTGWTRLAVGAVVAVAVTAGVGWRIGAEAALVSAAVWGVLIAFLTAHVYRARIVLTPREIVLKGALFRRRRSRARAVWTIRATVVQPRGGPVDTLFLLDAHGGVLVTVYGNLYRRADMDRLVDALGLPSSGPEGPVTPKELQRFRPGLVTWVERHPYLLGLVILGVLVLLVAVGVLVDTATTAG
ncbi:hypothetical protein [Nocardiopsis sp. HUAS JQ3]|uniref:hypothetical protein n=1 Tax=Nocardiopsis sp. HUAS JQ3 TaxID=3061629 RepID=UPI0023A9607D|nr:hypothetical protein [Nocardiopsis sp. HUAS JQ3]WDZ90207.1 hypothetical protein PV789_25465 [Nocardiopsis sp. HUAS JQ3]